MAEIVGSALLSAFFNVLFDKLATEEVKNFLRPKKVINKQLKKLEVSLFSAEELLYDAEEKLLYNRRVEKWHNELKDVVYKASELGDKIETEALRRNLVGHQSESNVTKMFTKLCSNPSNLCSNLLSSFDNYVRVELEEILSSLEHLLSQKDALGLEPAGTGRSNYSGVTSAVRFRVTPVADDSGFCGREDIKKTIIQSLRSTDVCDEKIGVIPIVGAGGLGKTTLAQIIYKDPDVKNHFPDARAWVTVSSEFDLSAIIKRIIGEINNSSQSDDNVDQQNLLFKLNDALKGKKFLLVLDDVWSEHRDEWDNLKSCFKSGEPGSKIIVTTRSTRVASIVAPNQPLHLLPALPEEDCRRLFEKIVFASDQDREARLDLQEIGKKIVEKCKGLPLSVKSVGGILRGDRDLGKWESILKSSVWELLQKNNKNIVPSLWLSYRYLPSDLKRCFAYCSIFPKDYRFKEEEVVQLWMAEGFLENVAGSTMEEVGKRYFEELISRSLFQSSGDWYYSDTFIMHDLVHDLAMYVSGKFCFWLDEDKILRGLACETRHLSYNSAIKDVKKFEGLSKAKRLHSFVGLLPSTLIMNNRELDILKVLEEVSVEGACLRVLSLSAYYKIDSLPDSVGKLKHLRYLNVSCTGVRELPHFVGTLYNLQTLRLSWCKNLTQLPESIGNLKQLRYLDLSYSDVRELPDSIGTLCNLQTLLLSSCEKLTQLPESIGNLKQLRCLNFSYSNVRELPDAIGTLHNLQTLLLLGCKNLTRLPSNLGSLINLHHLDTSDSPLEEMPPKMCNLKKLHTLTDFVLGKQSGSSIKDLEVLENLHGRIRVSGLQNITNVDDALKANLKNKKNLTELALEWEGQSDERDSRHEEKVLEALQPHASLKKFIISEYGGTSFPHWIGDSLFSKIKTVHLNNCKYGFFPALGRLPSLKELKIKGFHRVETIDDGFCGNDSPFRVLEVLHFEDMPEWNCWSFIEDDKDSVFPRLKELKLEGCPKLVGGLPNCNTITTLGIHKCIDFDFPGNKCRYPSLESLYIEGSCVSLNSFPLDHFPMLNELKLEELEYLVELTGYSPDEFEKLSIVKCPIFESFRFAEEPPLVLKSLTLSGLPKFVSFPMGGLPAPKLKHFDISECENLRSLPQQMNRLLPSLKSLWVSNCGEIESSPEGGLPSNLESLDIWGCKKLAAQVMHWDLQTLTPCLKSFSIDEWREELLDSFPPEERLPTSLTTLSIYNFRGLKTLNIHAFQHLEYLFLNNCNKLQCLTEESLPNSLVQLHILNCPLLEQRYRKETGEGWHKISHIPIVKIDWIEQH